MDISDAQLNLKLDCATRLWRKCQCLSQVALAWQIGLLVRVKWKKNNLLLLGLTSQRHDRALNQFTLLFEMISRALKTSLFRRLRKILKLKVDKKSKSTSSNKPYRGNFCIAGAKKYVHVQVISVHNFLFTTYTPCWKIILKMLMVFWMEDEQAYDNLGSTELYSV